MRIMPQQLSQHLKKGKMPFYLLYGSEAFLLDESAKLIRRHRQADEIQNIIINVGSDLDTLLAYLDQPSLFANTLFIDCKIAKINDSIMQKIVQILQKNYLHITFLFQMSHVTRQQQKASWFQFFEQKGVVIPHFRLLGQFSAWIDDRAKQLGVLLTPSLRQTLLANTEGNYFAAAQEIEGLRLLGTAASDIIEQSRYEVNDLCEALLTKKPERVIKILSYMKETGEAPQLVIWTLTQMLDLLLRCSNNTLLDIDKLLHQAGIRTHLHALYRQRLNAPLPFNCAQLLSCLFSADNQVKSGNTASAWYDVLNVCLQMTGIQVK